MIKILVCSLLIALPCVAPAATFVLGDAFVSDGTGSADSPSTGTDGFAGNQITTVYRVNDGVAGNPFNGGAPGGNFSPIVVGNIFGTDYRTTTTFDLSNIEPAPAGSVYSITDITIFFEVSSTGDQNSADAVLDLYGDLGITTGAIASAPSATLDVPVATASGTFLNAPLPNSLIDLNTDDEFTITLDVANANQGVRFGSDLSTPAFPNTGINGTDFAQVAPRLIINADIVPIPEPASSTILLIGASSMLLYRKRNQSL